MRFTDPDNEFPEHRVSTYGWVDYEAMEHVREDRCSWLVAEGAEVEETTYSEFQNTFSGNREVVGTNVTPASCVCGRYTDVTLRVECTFGEMLKGVLPENPIHL